MPELTAVWFVGAIICFIAVNLNLYSVHRGFQAESFRRLNNNLQPLNLYWSLEQANLIKTSMDLTQRSYQELDYKKSTRSAFIFGSIMIPLSWLGLIFLSIYYFSLHYFAKSRLEHNIFDSDLVKKNLPRDEARSLVDSIMKLNGIDRS